MANIGYLNPIGDNSYRGKISCLAFNHAVRIDPAPLSNNPRAPAYIISAYIDRNTTAEVGALFEETARSSGEIFYQGTIDDPSMERGFSIAVFRNREGGFNIAWTRRRPKRESAPHPQESSYPDDQLGQSTAADNWHHAA